MKKHLVISIITNFVFVLGSIFMTNAFCIYNDANFPIEAYVGGQGTRSFSQFINPGTYACCNYADTGCNPSGSRDTILTMQIASYCGCGYNAQIVAGQLISLVLIEMVSRS